MKTKIVLWGENAKEEKILLGIELLESENLIRIHIIPETDATEIFYNQMMNQWREGQAIPMPESTATIDRPLSMTEGLLPDDIKTERQDILARAKTEWHFVILSSKLYEAYADELNQIKERIGELSDFDGGIWEEMKVFWKKVQNQVQEKNLFREHAAELRTKTNELFDTLKSLKRAMNDEFEKASKENVDKFFELLEDIEERIEKGLGLQPIFNELKGIQNRFKDTKFTRKHHNDVWKRLDGAFKKVKEKKFGKASSGGNTALNRLTRRFDGLLAAIGKMEQSIHRDVKDKQFQERRIGTTDGQLEMQIRQAKMAMIEERIASKQTKLDDMLKTRADIEKKIELEKERAQKREEQRVAMKEVKEAKKSVEEDIAKEIEKSNEARKEDTEKLKSAAAAIKAAKKKTAKTPPADAIEQTADAQEENKDSGETVATETASSAVETTEPAKAEPKKETSNEGSDQVIEETVSGDEVSTEKTADETKVKEEESEQASATESVETTDNGDSNEVNADTTSSDDDVPPQNTVATSDVQEDKDVDPGNDEESETETVLEIQENQEDKVTEEVPETGDSVKEQE